MALSLYCAASVYVSQAKDDLDEGDSANLELVMKWMSAIGGQHSISRAYLNQTLLDIERNGLSTSFDFLPLVGEAPPGGHGIPLVARGSISRNSEVLPPLPGRLPLGSPRGIITVMPGTSGPHLPCLGVIGHYHPPDNAGNADDAGPPPHKRMRISARPDANVSTSKTARAGVPSTSPSRCAPWPGGRAGSAAALDGKPAPALFGYPGGLGGSSSWSCAARYYTTTTTLPHRTGSPGLNIQATSNMPAQNVPSLADFTMAAEEATFGQMSGLGDSIGFMAHRDDNNNNANNNNNNTNMNTINTNIDMPDLSVLHSMGEWGVMDSDSLYSMLVGVALESTGDFGTAQGDMSPWVPLNPDDGDGSAGGSWDTGRTAGSG